MTARLCRRSSANRKSFAKAYSAATGLDFPEDRLAVASLKASAAKAAFIRSTSSSDISSRLMRELRADPDQLV